MGDCVDPIGVELLVRQRSMVLAFLRRHVRDPHVAEDLAQETLLRGFRRLQDLREPRALPRWLRQIAYHVAMDWHRRGPPPEQPAAVLDAVAPAVDAGEPERGRARLAWSRRLLGALGRLSPRDRVLVIAHYFVGLSCREIAARCGLSLANVKVRLYRSRQILRRHLPDAEHDCPLREAC